MSEYIERASAYQLAKKICDAIDSDEFQRLNFGMRILDWIDDIPASNVRPVVLCRDCKFWFNAPVADGFNSCELDALIRHENFFCAAGEKREES